MLRSSPSLAAVLAAFALLTGCSSSPPPSPPPSSPPPAARADRAESVAPPASTSSGDPRLDAYSAERSREEDEKRTLAAGYIRSARNRMNALDYEAAARELTLAIKLDPANADARELLERAQWNSTGPRSGEFASVARALAEERRAKVEQLRVDIERLYGEGELLLEKGRYDAAIQRFEVVLEKIRWNPYELDERSSFRARTEAALARAKRH